MTQNQNTSGVENITKSFKPNDKSAPSGGDFASRAGQPTLGPTPIRQATAGVQGAANPVGYTSPATATHGGLQATRVMSFTTQAVFAPSSGGHQNPNVPQDLAPVTNPKPGIMPVMPLNRNAPQTPPLATPFYGPSGSPTIGALPEATTFGRGTGAPSYMHESGRDKMTQKLSASSSRQSGL